MNQEKSREFFIAIENEDVETVAAFVNDPDIYINYSRVLKTPLLSALQTGNKEIISLILNHPDIKITTFVIEYIITRDNPELLELVRSKFPESQQRKKMDSELIKPFMKTASFGHIQTVKYMVKSYKIEKYQILKTLQYILESPIEETQYFETFKYLIELIRGAYLTINGKDLLEIASNEKKTISLEYLLTVPEIIESAIEHEKIEFLPNNIKETFLF